MSAIYDRARYDVLTGALPWLTTDVLLAAYEGVPVFDPTHETFAEVNAANILVGTSLPVTGMAAAPDGTAQTDAIVIPVVAPGPPITFFVMYRATAPGMPILFIDEAEGLPFVNTGLDLVVRPDWALERGWWRP